MRQLEMPCKVATTDATDDDDGADDDALVGYVNSIIFSRFIIFIFIFRYSNILYIYIYFYFIFLLPLYVTSRVVTNNWIASNGALPIASSILFLQWNPISGLLLGCSQSRIE